MAKYTLNFYYIVWCMVFGISYGWIALKKKKKHEYQVEWMASNEWS